MCAARALRKHWKCPRGPFPHLVATMESHGIVVLLADDSGYIERVDAFSTVVADRPIVMSTPRRSRDVYRHRFTCAHELGHLLLHRGCTGGDITLEKQADEFAAELLTPAAEMQSLLPQRMDLGVLDGFGRIWGVSVESPRGQALLHHRIGNACVSLPNACRGPARPQLLLAWPPAGLCCVGGN
jgi:Zn-dependent peptidase ImmA (M78 family)